MFGVGGGVNVGGRGFCTNPSVLDRCAVGGATTTMRGFTNVNLSLLRVSREDGRFITIGSRTHTLVGRLLSVPTNCRIIFLNKNTDVRFYVIPCGLLGGGTSCLSANA